MGRVRQPTRGRRSRRRAATEVHDRRRLGGGRIGRSRQPGDAGRAVVSRLRRRHGGHEREPLRGWPRGVRVRIELPEAQPRSGRVGPFHTRDGHRQRLHLLGSRCVRPCSLQRDHLQPRCLLRRHGLAHRLRRFTLGGVSRPRGEGRGLLREHARVRGFADGKPRLRAPRHHAGMVGRADRVQDQRTPGRHHAQSRRTAVPRRGGCARRLAGR